MSNIIPITPNEPDSSMYFSLLPPWFRAEQSTPVSGRDFAGKLRLWAHQELLALVDAALDTAKASTLITDLGADDSIFGAVIPDRVETNPEYLSGAVHPSEVDKWDYVGSHVMVTLHGALPFRTEPSWDRKYHRQAVLAWFEGLFTEALKNGGFSDDLFKSLACIYGRCFVVV